MENYGYTSAGTQTVGTARQMPETETKRQPEISHQLDMLSRNASGLEEAYAVLEKRLCTILRPEGPGNTNVDKPQLRASPATDLGARMQEINDHLVGLRVRIEGALTRVEV